MYIPWWGLLIIAAIVIHIYYAIGQVTGALENQLQARIDELETRLDDLERENEAESYPLEDSN